MELRLQRHTGREHEASGREKWDSMGERERDWKGVRDLLPKGATGPGMFIISESVTSHVVMKACRIEVVLG
jgi:hypothetical protein